MSGPSCVNARDWSFVVVAAPEKLAQMADANGRPAEPLRKAAAGILVCGDLDRAFRFAKDYWIIDGAIAAQNICLAAQEPEIAPKNMLTRTVTTAKPPVTCPTQAVPKFTRRRLRPPPSISAPARIKKGIAISGKESSAVHILEAR